MDGAAGAIRGEEIRDRSAERRSSNWGSEMGESSSGGGAAIGADSTFAVAGIGLCGRRCCRLSRGRRGSGRIHWSRRRAAPVTDSLPGRPQTRGRKTVTAANPITVASGKVVDHNQCPETRWILDPRTPSPLSPSRLTKHARPQHHAVLHRHEDESAFRLGGLSVPGSHVRGGHVRRLVGGSRALSEMISVTL